jgi:integrase
MGSREQRNSSDPPTAKTRRRGRNGEGSIFPRKDSTGKVIGYVAQLDLGRGANGKRKRRNFYGLTAKAVQERMQKAREQHRGGTLPTSGKLTTGTWLRRWLDDVARRNTRHSTYLRYKRLVEQYMVPHLGTIPLEKLAPSDVRQMLNALAAKDAKDEDEPVKRRKAGQGLSPRSLHHLRAVLRTALNQAIADGLIARNVASLAKGPKVPASEMHAFDPEQSNLFLAAIKGDPFEALYTLALTTGMRKGELLGLRWPHVDLDAGTLHVTKALQRIDGELVLVDPKTDRSRRIVPLTTLAVDALKQHREQQNALAVKLGKRWLDDMGLVFTTPFGAPQDGSFVVRHFQAICRKAELPVIRFHDLRHSAVVLLDAAGVDVAVTSRMLGHSTITTTHNTYRHVFEKAQRQAAISLDRVLGGA